LSTLSGLLKCCSLGRMKLSVESPRGRMEVPHDLKMCYAWVVGFDAFPQLGNEKSSNGTSDTGDDRNSHVLCEIVPKRAQRRRRRQRWTRLPSNTFHLSKLEQGKMWRFTMICTLGRKYILTISAARNKRDSVRKERETIKTIFSFFLPS
jgi:hypothetical protein